VIASTIAAMRFGYGLPLPEGAPVDAESMLTTLAGPDRMRDRFPVPGTSKALALSDDVKTTSKSTRGMEKAARSVELQRVVDAVLVASLDSFRAAVARALDNPDGLRERLVQFWSDHFSVSRKGVLHRAVLPSAMVEDAIRPNLTAPFAQMLIAVTTNPAMLIYLDQDTSIGPLSTEGLRRKRGLNENLAREVLELHTVGVGAQYDQADVRQLAELMTGMSYTIRDGFVFLPERAEPGPEVVLGKTYGVLRGAGANPIFEALGDLAVRPETAQHIARKLAVHFLADDPDPAAVAAIAEAWTESGGDLGEVTAAMVRHPAAWVPPGGKVRQPFDYVVAGLRALGVTGYEVMAMEAKKFSRWILGPMAGMGQPWQTPRGPDGWPEEAEAWITPQALAARLRWSLEAPAVLAARLPDPRELVEIALADAASPAMVTVVGRAETANEAVGLILASPEFNRR
jgi:uncharacterized protein (DUF1800 family)